jgi:division protein CdvB (Snf7/Vps24/ESCRT-III family)
VLRRIGGTFGQKKPLKEQLAVCIWHLKIHRNKLVESNARVQRRHRDYFNKCVEAQLAKDQARAAMYASECAELRKIARITWRCELALEQVVLRLETVEAFGEVYAAMQPVVSVIQTVRTQVRGVMPGVSYELGNMLESLHDIGTAVGQVKTSAHDMPIPTVEGDRILAEASVLAEEEVRRRFPQLPAPDELIQTRSREPVGLTQ